MPDPFEAVGAAAKADSQRLDRPAPHHTDRHPHRQTTSHRHLDHQLRHQPGTQQQNLSLRHAVHIIFISLLYRLSTDKRRLRLSSTYSDR
jgi:hypothetical protein